MVAGTRCRTTPGQSSTKFDTRTLATLVRHVRSGDVLLTRAEELAVVMRELSSSKRDSRIVAAIEAAQTNARGVTSYQVPE